MVVDGGNCDKFLKLSAHEFAKLKTNNEKLDKDDPLVETIYTDLKSKVVSSKGPSIKKQVSSSLWPFCLTIRFEPCCVKMGPNSSAKSIDPGQPAQSAPADLDRYFLLLGNFHHVKGQRTTGFSQL